MRTSLRPTTVWENSLLSGSVTKYDLSTIFAAIPIWKKGTISTRKL